MGNLKILDSMLETLRDKPSARRAKTKGIQLDVYVIGDTYTIQCNGKTLETGNGTMEYAAERASDRAKRMQTLTGKPCTVTLY